MIQKTTKLRRSSPSMGNRNGAARPVANHAEKILAAARACFKRFGVSGTSLEEVAAEAGVSRPLLYQYFSNRQALMDALINKEIEDLVELQRGQLKRYLDFGEAVVKGAMVAIRLGQRDTLLMELMKHSTIEHLPQLLLDSSQPAHHTVLGLWQPIFEKARQTGELRSDVSDDELMEWLMSVHYMFLLRADVSPRRLKKLLTLFVVPALETRKPASK